MIKKLIMLLLVVAPIVNAQKTKDCEVATKIIKASMPLLSEVATYVKPSNKEKYVTSQWNEIKATMMEVYKGCPGYLD